MKMFDLLPITADTINFGAQLTYRQCDIVQ